MSERILAPHFDLTGKIFGRWTIVGPPERNKWGHYWYRCQCACGTVRMVVRTSLIGHNASRSCGCLQREVAHRPPKHGLSCTPEYRAWRSMKDRCCRKKSHNYHLYGGKGIKVCDLWLHSFEDFYADMGPRPSSQHSLDRFPDPTGNYCPENCRWATQDQQSNNKRNSRYALCEGKSLTIGQIARKYGVDHGVLYHRILVMGMSVEEAVRLPVSGKNTTAWINRWRKSLAV